MVEHWLKWVWQPKRPGTNKFPRHNAGTGRVQCYRQVQRRAPCQVHTETSENRLNGTCIKCKATFRLWTNSKKKHEQINFLLRTEHDHVDIGVSCSPTDHRSLQVEVLCDKMLIFVVEQHRPSVFWVRFLYFFFIVYTYQCSWIYKIFLVFKDNVDIHIYFQMVNVLYIFIHVRIVLYIFI